MEQSVTAPSLIYQLESKEYRAEAYMAVYTEL